MAVSTRHPTGRPSPSARAGARRAAADAPGEPGHGHRGALVAVVAVAVTLAMAVVGVVLVSRSHTDPAPTGLTAVDRGFLEDMIDHHAQAIQMANIALSRTRTAGVRDETTEVIALQQHEIDRMVELLHANGLPRPPTDRQVMGWMGMSMPFASMPGLASDSQLAALSAADGMTLDRMYFELMRAHHQGGVHMAQYAEAHASDPDVIALAHGMAGRQTAEMQEYDYVLRQYDGG